MDKSSESLSKPLIKSFLSTGVALVIVSLYSNRTITKTLHLLFPHSRGLESSQKAADYPHLSLAAVVMVMYLALKGFLVHRVNGQMRTVMPLLTSSLFCKAGLLT